LSYGDFNAAQTKEWIQKYFGSIKKELLLKEKLSEEPITETIKAKFEDTNIQIPMVVAAYRTHR
jgi:predicted Zn-dependent peptidase